MHNLLVQAIKVPTVVIKSGKVKDSEKTGQNTRKAHREVKADITWPVRSPLVSHSLTWGALEHSVVYIITQDATLGGANL